MAIAVEVVDDSGHGGGSGGRVGDGVLEGAVGVAEHDEDLAGGGDGTVADDDEVGVAVAVEIGGGDLACIREGELIQGEGTDAGQDIEAVGIEGKVVADVDKDADPGRCLADEGGGAGAEAGCGCCAAGGKRVGRGGEAGFGVEDTLVV